MVLRIRGSPTLDNPAAKGHTRTASSRTSQRKAGRRKPEKADDGGEIGSARVSVFVLLMAGGSLAICAWNACPCKAVLVGLKRDFAVIYLAAGGSLATGSGR